MSKVEQLLKHPGLWKGNSSARAVPSVSTGFGDLDDILPGGGWPQGALTEILPASEGIGELRLLLPALARLSHSGRWLACIAPPYIPYAPALERHGIRLSRLLLVHPRRNDDRLWAVEQALRSGNCAAVLAWCSAADDHSLRRLQLAAEAGNSMGFLFRDPRCMHEHSPAAVRLHLYADGDQAKNNRVRVHLFKCRGQHPPPPIQLELNDALDLRLPPGAGTGHPRSR